MNMTEKRYWKMDFPEGELYQKLIEQGRMIVNINFYFPSSRSRIAKDSFSAIRKDDIILSCSQNKTVSIYSVLTDPILTAKPPIEFIQEFGEEACDGEYLILKVSLIKEKISTFDISCRELERHLTARYSIRDITRYADIIEKAIADKGVWTVDSVLFNQLSSVDNIADYVRKNRRAFYKYEFSGYLQGLKEEKNLTLARIAKLSGVGNYVYKIFNNEKNPSRDVLICIGIGMGLSVDEMQTLLKYARFARLDPRYKRDAVIIFGLYHHLAFEETNDILNEFNEAALFEN